MGARHELNRFHILGAVGVAALLGSATGSWAVFAIVGGMLIAAGVRNGGIRGRKRRQRRSRE